MKINFAVYFIILCLITLFSSDLYAGQVTGEYIGNDKSVQLKYAWAGPAEKWQDEDSYIVVLSEKSPEKSSKPDFDALFGRLGNALIVNVTKSGSLFGTQVYHEALKSKGFSTSGTVNLDNFKLTGKTISGHLTSGGMQSFFDDKWKIDLEFSAEISK